MSDRINHVATALGATKNAGGLLNQHDDTAAGAMATIALAHATLALVEQQRIANVIALAHVALTDATTQVTPIEQAAWEAIAQVGNGKPRPEIREALGL